MGGGGGAIWNDISVDMVGESWLTSIYLSLSYFFNVRDPAEIKLNFLVVLT